MSETSAGGLGRGRPPPVSVVVITWNREREIGRCLRSLLAQTHRPLEIIVVDDGSTDGTRAAVERAGAEAPADLTWRLVGDGVNRGIGGARNAGIEAARGEIIAFTDDDCVADPDWVAALVRAFDEEEDVAVVGGAIREPPDRTWAQRAAEGINFLGTRLRPVTGVNGCNMAFRADFLRAHPFDPAVRYGADEIDLCYTAAEEGRKILFTPDARVTHHHRRSVRAFFRQQFLRGRGSVWVRRKHHRGLWPRKHHVSLLLTASAAAAALFPGRTTLLVLAGAAVLFLATVLALDLARRKPLASILVTLPLTAAGYLAEFAGALVAAAGRRPARR